MMVYAAVAAMHADPRRRVQKVSMPSDGKSKVDIKENCIIIAFSSGETVCQFLICQQVIHGKILFFFHISLL
jgi:hypothetical protein